MSTIRSLVLGDLVVLGAGAILPFAFAPYSLFPIAVASVALLFWCWLPVSPRRAMWRGWLYGLGMFGMGISWVYISIHRFGHLEQWFAALLTGLFIVLMAMYPALLGYLANRLFKGSHRTRLLITLPALWTLFEWLRGRLFTGFPWLDLGYSQIDSPLGGLAPILGVFGVGWAVAFTAGALCYIGKERSSAWPRYVFLLLVLWVGAGFLARVEWTSRVRGPLDVALIQGNISQDQKWLPARLEDTLERYLELSSRHYGSDIIVWPETAIPMFSYQAQGFIDQLQQLSQRVGTDFLVGVPHRSSDSAKYFNSVISIGKQPGTYLKRHLVPFGEYFPLEPIVRPILESLNFPLTSFSRGERKQPLLVAGGQRIGLSICYEDTFGREVIDSLPEAGLLVNVSNDAWFGDSFAPHQHLEMARMRALEGGRYMLRATNTGVSAIIDPHGDIVDRSPQFQSHELSGEIWGYANATPYVRWGDRAVVLLVFLALMWGTIRERGEKWSPGNLGRRGSPPSSGT